MGQLVVAGAMMSCTFGVAPASLAVLPDKMVTSGAPAANIMDHKPMVNIPMFGMCSAPTNPAVIAATSAASGVFTPAPCVPATSAPWTPGATTTLVKSMPALESSSTCMCTWAGVISINSAGQFTVTAG